MGTSAKPLLSLKPLDATTWLKSLLSNDFLLWLSGAGPVSRAYVPGACQDDAKDVVFEQLRLLVEDVCFK